MKSSRNSRVMDWVFPGRAGFMGFSSLETESVELQR